MIAELASASVPAAAVTDARTAQRYPRMLFLLICSVSGLLLLTLAVHSLAWEYEHDTPLLQYCGYLMQHFHWVPYRDFFETSMPGVLLFHAALVTVFGTGNTGFMIADHLLLAVLLLTSFVWLRELSLSAAWLFVGWYGVFYLASGPWLLLQRDWLALLPASLAFALLARSCSPAVGAQLRDASLIGVLAGIAAIIKPHLALGFVPIVCMMPWVRAADAEPRGERWRKLCAVVALAALGGTLPVVASLAWLAHAGALTAFASMVRDYLPLHLQQSGAHVFLAPAAHARYLLVHALYLGGLAPLLACAAVGGMLVDRQLGEERRKQLLFRCVCAVLAIYALVPVLAGQFWDYHYQPFQYWLIALLSLLALPLLRGRAAVSACAALLLTGCWLYSARHSHTFAARPAKGGLVAAMASTLERYVPPGAPVQPLDWTSGAVHALLRTGHPLGTQFLYDYHFYHHVATPYIQSLRGRFLAELVERRVSFILEVRRPYKDVVSGVGTSDRFDALTRLLEERYETLYETPGYRLLRLKAP